MSTCLVKILNCMCQVFVGNFFIFFKISSFVLIYQYFQVFYLYIKAVGSANFNNSFNSGVFSIKVLCA